MCEGKGFVPEPSKKRIKAFFDGLGKMAKNEAGIEDMSEEQALASLNTVLEDADKDRSKLEGLISDFTQRSPSKEELSQLPPRYFSAFTAYLIGELSDPNA